MKIVVTGGHGMVGSNLQEIVNKDSLSHTWLFPTSSTLNLFDEHQCDLFFSRERPDFIIHLAANVGGLFKNLKYKVEMLHDNLILNENVLKYSHKYNVQNGLFLASTCVFPHSPSSSPMTEDMIMEGEPHPSNESYGYAKRILYLQCKNYNQQYGRHYKCLSPCNLFGKYDNFNLETSHVVSALIHKFYLHSLSCEKLRIPTGISSKRQLISAKDLCRVLLLFVQNFDTIDKTVHNVIIAHDEYLITDVITSIHKRFPNVSFEIENKEDGQKSKTCSTKLFQCLFPDFTFSPFDQELNDTIDFFIQNYDTVKK